VLGLFGHEFDTAYVPLLILLAGYCASTCFGEVGFMLSMTRYQKQASVFVLVGIAANCIAAVLLVPRLGATGAAIGASLSLFIWRGLAWRFVTARLGIEPSVFGRSQRARRAS
jgi:O-antigen/teichoic acid export membrane protein